MLTHLTHCLALQVAPALAVDAAPQPHPATLKRASAHAMEVQRLRLRLQDRDETVERLRADIAALKVSAHDRSVQDAVHDKD